MTTNPINIISPRQPMVDKAGIVTEPWWRWFNQVFQMIGTSGGSNSIPAAIAQLEVLTFSEFGRSGPDYDKQIGDLRTLLFSLPSTAGRIAALEQKVKYLETLVASGGHR